MAAEFVRGNTHKHTCNKISLIIQFIMVMLFNIFYFVLVLIFFIYQSFVAIRYCGNVV